MTSWWDRVADIVEQARVLPVEQRPAFLDEACGDDAALRRDVETVLGNTPPGDFLEPAEKILPAGHQLGEFTLLRPVGRGGMGVVYLARQRALREAAALDERLAAVKVFPRTRERLERAGVEVVSLPLSEFQKAEAGPTCLTLRTR